MFNKIIHQFSPAVSVGDSVSNALFYTQKILIDLGFISNIYSNFIDEDLKDKVFHIDEYTENSNSFLLYHHSIGHIDHDKIMLFLDKKILVYHNITPSHFFKYNKFLQEACDWGREQLKDAQKYVISAYADSSYNKKELDYYSFPNTKVLPILVDFIENTNKLDNDFLTKYSETINIIFIGRIVSNKCQDKLIDVIYYLKNVYSKKIKLILIGGISQGDYLEYIEKKINLFSLTDCIEITNKVSEKNLFNYYSIADLYLSLSEHEGFGMPLIEAMKFDIPVLAYNCGGVKTAIGKKGLLNNKSPLEITKRIIHLLQNPYEKRDLIQYQKQHLKKFDYERTKFKLARYLNRFGFNLDLKNIKVEKNNQFNIQIEGPFDSSYSLSIVNSNLAKALNYFNNTKLYSTEGLGDFNPNEIFLQDNLDIKSIFEKKFQNIELSIRNLYPPRTNAMKGIYKVLGPYGWEESSFPKKFIELFNNRLSFVLCMSNYVKDVLIKNGLSIPCFVVGIGVNHILETKLSDFKYKLPNGFKILHISSCFPRKGVPTLLEVFYELIEEGYNFSLIIKTFPNIHNNIKDKVNALPEKVKDKILYIDEEFTQSEISYLYENCDCLVAPSYGEGFGLPMAEAMLYELPVITTGYGGQTDFCNEENSWLIDYDFELAQTHMNLFNSYWVNPKKSSLKNEILEVYNSKDNLKIKTSLAKENILNNYKWSDVANRIVESISTFKNTKNNSEKLKISWITTYNTKCGIASYSNSLISNIKDYEKNMDINIFANKVNYNELLDVNIESNVIRCWNSRFDNNNLELIENLKKDNSTHIVVQFNFAFFSMKNLAQIIDTFSHKKLIVELHSVKDVKEKGIEASLGSISSSLKKVKTIIVHNIEELNVLKKFGLVQNIALLPLGVSLYTANSLKKYLLKMKYSIPSKRIIATYGFLLPHKGILELIEAYSLVKEQNPQTHLLLLNSLYPSPISINYQKECIDKIEQLSLVNNVTFINDYLEYEDSFELLNMSELLVLVYKNTQESASASIRELLSTGNPVLCSNESIFNDVKDIVHFIDDFTIESIAKNINDLLTSQNLFTSKIEIQKNWIEEHSWKNISKIFLNILKNFNE